MPKKSDAAVPKNWQNRIVDYTEESPEQLLANPLNWRVHSRNQQIALSGVLDDIGFIAPVIVNQRTGHLVDGHLRVSLALRHNIPTIPVVYVNISEDEEKEALTTFDPIGAMASSDMQMLEGLIQDLGQIGDAAKMSLSEILKEANKKAVKNVLDPMSGYEGTELPPDVASNPEMAGAGVLPRSAASVDGDDDEEASPNFSALNTLFGQDALLELGLDGKKNYPAMLTDNEWGVPALNPLYQLRQVPAMIERWGRVSRHNSRMPGLWHFYTEDYRFSTVWKNPDMVVKTGCIAAIEPNYSTGTNFAKAEVLYNIWQKRWLASYWQTHGMEIVVDLNVESKFMDIAFLGVPHGWRAYAIRLHEAEGYGLESVLEWEDKAKEHAGTSDILFLCFSTKSKGVEEICRKYNWVNCKMDMHVIGAKI
jgi:hypothetical protein